MAPGAADDLPVMRGIALDPAHDGREILPTLGLEALDQVGAGLFAQRRVIAVVALPDPAAGRVDLLLEPGDGVAGRELREAVLAVREEAGARWQAGAARRRGEWSRRDLERTHDFPAPCEISLVFQLS